MFEKLSYKQKFLVLLGIIVMLSMAAYKRSFKLTINAYNEYQELNEKLNYINSSSSNIRELDAEINFLDNLIGKEGMEPELVQQEILNFVTNQDKDIDVYKIEEIHEASDNKFLIYSNQLTIEGAFEDLLKIVYEFEKKFQYSRVVHVNFFKKKDFRTKRVKLYAKIIFQNYEKSI